MKDYLSNFFIFYFDSRRHCLGIDCAVQCQPRANKIKDAIYKLRNPVQQIESFVGDVVRAHVPKVRVRCSLFAVHCLLSGALRTC